VTICVNNLPVVTIELTDLNMINFTQHNQMPTIKGTSNEHLSLLPQHSYHLRHNDLGFQYLNYDYTEITDLSRDYSIDCGILRFRLNKSQHDCSGLLIDVGVNVYGCIQIRHSIQENGDACYWVASWTGPTLVSTTPFIQTGNSFRKQG
jgi:hypothetical protein